MAGEDDDNILMEDKSMESEAGSEEPHPKRRKTAQCPFKHLTIDRNSVTAETATLEIASLQSADTADDDLPDDDNSEEERAKEGMQDNNDTMNDSSEKEVSHVANGYNQRFQSDVEEDDLRQFDVLDDLERNSDQDGSDYDTDSNESMDSDVPDEEIEAMLEEGNLMFFISF